MGNLIAVGRCRSGSQREPISLGRLAGLLTVLLAACAALAMPSQALAMASPQTFVSTGSQQAYTVPSGVLVEGVMVQGGWGGSTDPQPPASNNVFAAGATLQGYLATTPGQTLYVEVGQNGTSGGGATFGGGAAAGAPPPGVPNCKLSGSDMSVPCDGPWAGSGGGASDIRTCSELAASCPGGGPSSGSRLIVAAGGGGEGGGGLVGNGAGCDNGGDAGGIGQNNQLPTASSAGPSAITIAAGIVIPGFGGGNSDSTAQGSTNAAAGSTVAGSGGVRTECSLGTAPNTVTYFGSVAGGSGTGLDGGAGGSASALSPCCGSPTFAPGAGGGGGGGYFGGGGGATGMGSCSGALCNGNGGTGQGGAAGSSFASHAIEYPTFTFSRSAGDVFIEFWPIIEIDTPANGAVYSPGQVVDAQWECDGYSQGPGGCDNSSGTAPSGSAIDTSPGTHTFTVNAKVNVTGNGSQPVSGSVTYTVKAAGGGPAAAKITKAVISSKHHSAEFRFRAAGATSFQCALTEKPKPKHKRATPHYGSCTSPKTYRHLRAGSYTFFVRAVSGTTSGRSSSRSFKIG